MRASLRGSRKLKALQDHSSKSLLQQQQLTQQQHQQLSTAHELVSDALLLRGVENEAYLEDETEKDKIVGKIYGYFNKFIHICLCESVIIN